MAKAVPVLNASIGAELEQQSRAATARLLYRSPVECNLVDILPVNISRQNRLQRASNSQRTPTGAHTSIA